jgi:hypothetical protein
MRRLPKAGARALVTSVAAAAAVLSLTASPAHAGTGGQDYVSGYTQASCNAAGAADSQQRMNEGYTVTFIGCYFDAHASPWYVGTVSYHKGGY